MPRIKSRFTSLPVIDEEEKYIESSFDNNGTPLIGNNHKSRNSNSPQKFSNEEFFKVVKSHEHEDVKKKRWSPSATLCLWSVFIALCAIFLLFIAAIIEGRGFAKSVNVHPELFTMKFPSAQNVAQGESFLPLISIGASLRVKNDLPFIVEVGSAYFYISYALLYKCLFLIYIVFSHVTSYIVF
jgi:hypothetical protein